MPEITALITSLGLRFLIVLDYCLYLCFYFLCDTYISVEFNLTKKFFLKLWETTAFLIRALGITQTTSTKQQQLPLPLDHNFCVLVCVCACTLTIMMLRP